jgi:purine-nucleoside phosphorylase
MKPLAAHDRLHCTLQVLHTPLTDTPEELMLKELGRADWLGILNIPEARVPRVLVLRGTRNLRSQYEAVRPFLSNIMEVGSPNGIFEDVLIGDVAGHSVGFACVYGANMASEITHVFGVLGTRAVIQTGNCGAIADGFNAGDLFLAERAFCGEGAAQYYQPGTNWVDASSELFTAQALTALGAHQRGAIYTTAAMLAEGMDDLETWFHQGFTAVDMETATTFAVAAHFGMARLSLLYAFDNPRRREHLALTDAEKDIRRAAANQKMKETAFALAVELAARP